MEIKVTLLNKQELIDNNAFSQIGDFARIGTGSMNDSEVIGKHCVESSHGSPQRVPRFIFQIEGVSRTETHQHVRHNVGIAHNQRSQRYCIEDGFDYYKPKEFNGKKYLILLEQKDEDTMLELSYDDMMQLIRKFYIKSIEDNISPDEAREILANAVGSKINSYFTYQALIHFCNERLCSRASRQIREVARQMVEEVKSVDPKASEYLVPKCHFNALGYCPEDKRKSCGLRSLKADVILE